jgi:hypothetical protein
MELAIALSFASMQSGKTDCGKHDGALGQEIAGVLPLVKFKTHWWELEESSKVPPFEVDHVDDGLVPLAFKSLNVSVRSPEEDV